MRVSSAMFCLVLAGAVVVPAAKADEWDKKMTVTVNQRVEVPGKVLDPGTYVFRLAESSSNRDIVQILNQDENELYQTVIAQRNYRLHPSGSTVINLRERTAGTPDAISAVFYPGDNYGEEFIYPPAAAVAVTPPAVAQAPPQPQCPAPCPPQVAEARPPQPAPEAQPAPQPQPETQPVQPAPQPAPAQPAPAPELPRTASNEPLLGLFGLLALAAGLGLRFALKRAA